MLQYVMQKIYEHDQNFFHWLPKIIKEIEAGSLIDIDLENVSVKGEVDTIASGETSAGVGFRTTSSTSY